MGQYQQADGGWQQAGKKHQAIKTKRSKQKATSKNRQEVKNWQTGKIGDRMHTGKNVTRRLQQRWPDRQSGRGQVKVGWYIYRQANEVMGNRCAGVVN